MLKLGKKTNCFLLLCLFCATSNAQFYFDLSSGVAIRQKFSVFLWDKSVEVVHPSINAAEQFQFGYKSSKYISSISLAYYNTSFLLDHCKYSGEPPGNVDLYRQYQLEGKGYAVTFHPRIGANFILNRERIALSQTFGLNLMLDQGVRNVYGDGKSAIVKMYDTSSTVYYYNFSPSIQNKAITSATEIEWKLKKWTLVGTIEGQYKFKIFKWYRNDRLNAGRTATYNVWEDDVFQLLCTVGIRRYIGKGINQK
ncbi:MAG: hypothetical protein RLZZ252_1695 [Bacteroidota bacterium]